MGNCLIAGGPGLGRGKKEAQVIKVVRSNGGIMEFRAPIAAESITKEFPGQGLFWSHDLFSRPLSPHDELAAGQSYFLLPVVRQGHVPSGSIPEESLAATYRTSVEYQGALKRSYTDVLSRYVNNGDSVGGAVWKVKLVITPEMLGEILSEDDRTQDLVDSVRTVAKCGSVGRRRVSHLSLGFSDQWSFCSSSRNNGEFDL